MEHSGASESGVATVTRAIAHFGEGDFDAMFELVHPEAEFHPVFYPGSYTGRESIRAVFEDGASRLGWSLSGLVFDEVEGRVLVHGRLHSTNTFGSPEELPIAWLFDVVDGLIVEMRGFVHPRQARAAVG